MGVATIKLDATPNGKPLYEKLGFVTEYEIERWALGPHTQPLKPDSTFGQQFSESEKLEKVVNLNEILKVDREAFGADRSALLLSLHRESLEFTAALYHEGSLVGYTLGRHGSRADHIGPWMAKNETAARQLLTAFLARTTREMIFVDCLKSSPFVSRLLASARFEFSRPLTRMVRGANIFAGRPEPFCAILGPEFG